MHSIVVRAKRGTRPYGVSDTVLKRLDCGVMGIVGGFQQGMTGSALTVKRWIGRGAQRLGGREDAGMRV